MKLSVRLDGLGNRIARSLPERIREAVRQRVRSSRDTCAAERRSHNEASTRENET
jgi:hypothetical protein